jgi:anti-sigma regulatory factor (Ser/Thr protein kinase)
MDRTSESIRLPARIENFDRLMGWILGLLREKGFPEERIQEVELASEEALVNIIRHGFPGREPGDVAIRCTGEPDDSVEIEFSDDGVPFDPTSLAQPDLILPVEERPVGGLGVFLIRRLIDEVRYRREGGRNILTWMVHRQRGG